MATYTGIGRTNTFYVKDAAAVKTQPVALPARVAHDGLEPVFTVVDRDTGTPGAVSIFADEDGDWQTTLFAGDDDDEGTEIYLPDWIVDHLQPGETAVFVHIGNEGKRHLGAFAIAVHSDGRQIHLNLDEIYQRARAEFGATSIDIAAY